MAYPEAGRQKKGGVWRVAVAHPFGVVKHWLFAGRIWPGSTNNKGQPGAGLLFDFGTESLVSAEVNQWRLWWQGEKGGDKQNEIIYLII
ncbi:MAG: hypothetical protein Kow0031_15550 [Anaerolineae bacterium]